MSTTSPARWRIEFKVYRNDRLVHKGYGHTVDTYRAAAHLTTSDIENADNQIEGAR